ncbi:MAG: TrkA family potassium uptake protein [Halanaerobiales bacterium]|nr:TrkA family potassium uptake protein [Halanaerobiales bacterium]
MRIIIIGDGKVTYHLIKKFIAKGYEVSIINPEQEYCDYIASKTNALVIKGDGTNPYSLKQAGAMKADIILALTDNDPNNLFICQVAKNHFQIPKTFSVINNPDNEQIFKKLGVETVFNTTKLISILIEQRVEVSNVSNLISIEEGRLNISQIILQSNSPVLGKSLKEIDLPHDIVFGCIIRDDQVLIPKGDTKLLEGDKALIITLPEKQAEAYNVLIGE